MKCSIGRRAALVVVAAGFLAGCAQVPRQAFNAQAAAHVKALSFADIAEAELTYEEEPVAGKASA